MEIRVSRSGAVPVREQLIEQIRLLIGSGELKPGEALPSVRELARKLKIHHNTVSHAYQELSKRGWLTVRPGSGVFVSRRDERSTLESAGDLDGLINAFLAYARQRGYSLQQVRARVRQRMTAQPPDHFLIVEPDPSIAAMLTYDITAATGIPVSAATPHQLAGTPGLAIGAVVAASVHTLQKYPDVYPSHAVVVPIEFPRAREFMERVRALEQPSVIVIASHSQEFREAARGVLAAASGRKHEICDCRLEAGETPSEAADLMVCDTHSRRRVRARAVMLVPSLSKKSLAALQDAMGGRGKQSATGNNQ